MARNTGAAGNGTRSRAFNRVAAATMLSEQRPAAIDPIGAKGIGEPDQDRREHKEGTPSAHSCFSR